MLYIVILVLIVLFLLSFRIVQEYQRAIVFRLGRYHSTRGPGVYWMIPIIEWKRTVDVRTTTVDVERQENITKDSVTVRVNAVLWYRISDPAKSVIAVADHRSAVYQLALTTLRNIIGQHELDDVLKERDKINHTLQEIIDAATDPWGVKVEMVEMKDVEIPEGMQRAMARQAEASRERLARIIKADAEYEAAKKLSEASKLIEDSPAALELRRMQMVAEVGVEQNTTTMILIPSDFVMLARALTDVFQRRSEPSGGSAGAA